MLDSFSVVDHSGSKNAREEFATNGYVVFRELIPPHRIDALVTEFKMSILHSQEVVSRQPRFSREVGDLNYPYVYDSPQSIDDFGHMVEGIKDPHVLDTFPSFACLSLGVLCSREVFAALELITGFNCFTVQQSMFFDANQETEPHQDGYYIDSSPRGFLVGIWFALEDIGEEAGRFYVLRESHRKLPIQPSLSLSNSEYLNACKRYFDDHKDSLVVPALSKGDAVCWNSGVIHGALRTHNRVFSRKSLTSHITPAHMKGCNQRRIFNNAVIRRLGRLNYVVTNKPDTEKYRIVERQVNKIAIGNSVEAFTHVTLANREEMSFTESVDD